VLAHVGEANKNGPREESRDEFYRGIISAAMVTAGNKRRGHKQQVQQ
jgi:hypothetical protein